MTHAVVVHGGGALEGDGFWTTGANLLEFPLVEDSDEVTINGQQVELETTFDLVNNAGSYLHAGGFTGDIGFGDRDNGKVGSGADRFAACGAAMSFRRETWDRLGGFAEEFFAYYEDIDWSWRAQRAGMRVRYEPSLVVRHVHGQTAGPGTSAFALLRIPQSHPLHGAQCAGTGRGGAADEPPPAPAVGPALAREAAPRGARLQAADAR